MARYGASPVTDDRRSAPEVTVVIPFLGDVAWLEESVQSVLRQTLSSLEVVVVSDAARSATAHLSDWDERIRLLEGDGSGPAAARNIGVRTARGRFVAFLDADDVLHPSKLERQVEAMKTSGYAFSHTSYDQISRSGEPICTRHSGRFGGEVYPTILLQCPIATPTVTVRADLLGDQPFPEHLRVGDDTLLWIALARRTPLLGIDEALTFVRMHETNAGLDPTSQLIAWHSILNIAVPQDPTLSPEIRRHTTLHIQKTIALLEKERGRHFAAALASARAVVASMKGPYDLERFATAARRRKAVLHHHYMRAKIALSRVKRAMVARAR